MGLWGKSPLFDSPSFRSCLGIASLLNFLGQMLRMKWAKPVFYLIQMSSNQYQPIPKIRQPDLNWAKSN